MSPSADTIAESRPEGRAAPAPPHGGSSLLKASSIASVLLALLWLGYFLLAWQIHSYPPGTDVTTVAPWVWVSAREHDGRELKVMFAAVTATLGLAVWIGSRLDGIPWFRGPVIRTLCMVPAAVLVVSTVSTTIQPLESSYEYLVALGVAMALIGAVRFGTRLANSGRAGAVLVPAFAWALVTAAFVLVVPDPLAVDYSHFIAPALKLAQGEPLSGLLFQYNALGVYLFRGMMALGCLAHEMQAVLAVLVAASFLLYHRLALRLFEDRVGAALLVLFLVIVRFLAVMGAPTFVPQVSAIRMELWLPPAFVLARCGWRSPWTAATFAAVYVADNLFGLMYFGLYALVVAAMFANDFARRRRPTVREIAGVGLPLAAGAAIERWICGGFTNPMASTYKDMHLGFLPIEFHSLFWPVAWLLLLSAYPIVTDPVPERRRVGLFLVGVTALQLVYFYGRSHDNNLLNIAGTWSFVAFLAIDRATASLGGRSLVGIAGEGLVCVAALVFAAPAEVKLERAADRLSRGVLIEPAGYERGIPAVEKGIAAFKGPGRKLMFFGAADGYINYRCGLPQAGKVVPFYANFGLDQTVAYLLDLRSQGYQILCLRETEPDVLGLNSSRLLVDAKKRFAVLHLGRVCTVEVEPR